MSNNTKIEWAVDLTQINDGIVGQINALRGRYYSGGIRRTGLPCTPYVDDITIEDCNKLKWVICGGETGHHARPMEIDWVRLLRDQCVAADVPFFFKSTGGKNKTDLLDGIEWKQFPREAQI